MTVQVGDSVAAGDLLAELEASELEDRLAQAQLNLQTTEATLSRAEQDSADALFEARISLEKLGIRLEQAQAQDTEASISIAYIRLRQAETSLANAQEAYDRAWEPARDWELQMTDPTGVPPFQGPSMSDQLKQERDGTARGLTMANDNLTIARSSLPASRTITTSRLWNRTSNWLNFGLSNWSGT
jgi:multidrug efflux pump subunit AcrA (membrane-fusion protein)